MTKAFTIGLAALVCVVTASAAAAQTPASPAQAPTGKGPRMPDFDHPVGKQFTFPDFVSPQLKAQYPGNVEATFGLTYATITGVRPLKLDVYRTPGAGPKPAIIFVHGGSYVNGDPKNDRNPIFGENDGLMAYVASRGYVVIPVTYRLADEGKWPSQLQDVKAAIRWVRGNAAEYGVDPRRIGVWGESAGGHIAAMVGATCGIKEFDEQKDEGIYGNSARGVQAKFADQSSCVQAAVAWSATTDFAQLDPQSESFARLVHNTPASSQSRVLGCALGSTCNAATVERANVLHYVNQGGASKTAFLLAAGTKDEATPWQQSRELYDGLRKRGVPAQLQLVKDVDHYFIGATREQSKEILNTFFGFLQRHLN